MNKTTGALLACGALVALVGGYLAGQSTPKKAAPVEAAKTADDAPLDKAEADDADAIRKAGQSFVKSYVAGDAKAMAAHWTEKGEYFADDGTVLRGRAEIQKSYEKQFAKKGKEKVEAKIEVTSIRFPSKDTAIEEGYFEARSGKDAPSGGRYTVLHAREGGKWLMAVVREWPSEGASLRDLAWLIGSWRTKRGDEVEVRTKYEWWGDDKAFIRAEIKVVQKGRTAEGFQMIGKDAATGAIRSWVFDRDGGFAQATWSRDGKKWVQDFASVLADGGTVAATHVLTRLDDDTFTFQAVERTLDGEAIADVPTVRVTRVKGE